MCDRVIIIGGGLAGLAAATALAPKGYRVTILESRPRLGGRASSFIDPATGQLIDNCQHVSMGCCTTFAHFCRTVGIDHLLAPQSSLYFMTPDGSISQWQANFWPAPFHLAGSFWHTHFLSWLDKLRIAWGLVSLLCGDGHSDPRLYDWLIGRGQSASAIERFWGLILTSALNEAPDRAGLRYARKVFLDGFFRDRRGWRVELPAVPLGRLYGEELQAWLQHNQVEVRLNEGVRRLLIHSNQVQHVELRNGESLQADRYLSAIPPDRLLDLLPEEVAETHACFRNLRRLQMSPIASVHLWYDRPVLSLPHLILVGCLGQWVFNRGESAPGEHYLQIVVSAARQFDGMKQDEVKNLIAEELCRLFPECKRAKLLRAKVVTERSATFSVVPGVDRWRPKPWTPIKNLFLAGDWTATGWPATMESAVRSGYLAAEAIRENREE